MNEKIMLWNDQRKSYIKPFLINDGKPHPAVLIIPGGAYRGVCEASEGTPIAQKFNQSGLNAFVLVYRVFPCTFPAPQQDAMRAMRIIRGNAEKYQVDSNRLGICGFSAGGHLGATLGTAICENVDASNGDDFDQESFRPDFLILCYGVLSFRDDLAFDSKTARNLLGENEEKSNKMYYSPDKQVTENTPPSFIWHTVSDQIVDYRCSVFFAQALAEKYIPVELHLFPFGRHGMLQGIDTPDVSDWPRLARRFIAVHTGEIKLDPDTYTNAYQCKAENGRSGFLIEQ